MAKIEIWPRMRNGGTNSYLSDSYGHRDNQSRHVPFDTEIVETGNGSPKTICLCRQDDAARIVAALNMLSAVNDQIDIIDLRLAKLEAARAPT